MEEHQQMQSRRYPRRQTTSRSNMNGSDVGGDDEQDSSAAASPRPANTSEAVVHVPSERLWESHHLLDQEVRTVCQDVEIISDRVSGQLEQMNDVQQTVEQVRERLATVKGRVSTLEQDFGRSIKDMQASVTLLKNMQASVTSVQQQLVELRRRHRRDTCIVGMAVVCVMAGLVLVGPNDLQAFVQGWSVEQVEEADPSWMTSARTSLESYSDCLADIGAFVRYHEGELEETAMRVDGIDASFDYAMQEMRDVLGSQLPSMVRIAAVTPQDWQQYDAMSGAAMRKQTLIVMLENGVRTAASIAGLFTRLEQRTRAAKERVFFLESIKSRELIDEITHVLSALAEESSSPVAAYKQCRDVSLSAMCRHLALATGRTVLPDACSHIHGIDDAVVSVPS